jgi:hypothetical protein
MSEKTTDQMVRELYAIEQIKQLKARNLRHLDLKQWDEMAETFAPNCTTRWVDGKLCFEGREAIMEFMKKTPFAVGEVAITVHQPASAEIEITGETTAKGTWRLYNPVIFRHTNHSYLLLAFYHDEYEKIDGEWKISHTGHEYLLEEAFDRKDVASLKAHTVHPF